MLRLNPTAKCDALFASYLQPSQHPDSREVRLNIRRTIRTLGAQACAAQVAQEFGDHPETAVTRMCWARQAVSRAYRDSAVPRRLSLRPTAVTVAQAYAA